MTMIWAVLLGLCAGILAGMAGIGGGILLVPGLVYLFHMSQHRAQGTSLGVLLLPTGLFAVWKYFEAGNVDFKMVLLISLGLLAGGYLGGRWAQNIPDDLLRKCFSVFLIIVAIKMFFNKG